MAGQQSAPSSLPQSVTQVSLLGQLPKSILEQVSRRLQIYAEHELAYTLSEDVLTRGYHDPNAPLRTEDVLRVRALTIDGTTESSINILGRPLPIRENAQVLIRSISSVPVFQGNAGALAVALGFSEGRFAFKRKGIVFTAFRGLISVYLFQLYSSANENEPLDKSFHLIEVVACTSNRSGPSLSALANSQSREQAVQRALEVKRILEGLVELSRVE